MNAAEWATLAVTVLGFLVTIGTTQLSQAKTRGMFQSLLRNYPLHRHIKVKVSDGTYKNIIDYPAEFPAPPQPAGANGVNDPTA